jgi:outer membrane murein-binding lipoprotein Lpp
MTPLVELWIASVIGAGLFLATGIALARVMRHAEQVVEEAGRKRLEAELEQVRLALTAQTSHAAHLEQRLQSAEQSALTLSDALARSRARGLSPEAREQLNELRRRIGETARAREHWQGQANDLRLASARAENAANLEKAALREELERIKGEQRERNAGRRSLLDQVARLEQAATENVLLKKERDSLASELSRRDSTLPGEAVARSAPPQSGFVLPAAHPRLISAGEARDDTLAGILERQLSMLGAREPGVTAVLSDEQGLPLVGTGTESDQEGVSVLTSLVQDLSQRAHDLVGLDRVVLMEMVGTSGRALRVRFFEWDEQPLALGYLGARRLAQSDDEERMVSTFPKLRAS